MPLVSKNHVVGIFNPAESPTTTILKNDNYGEMMDHHDKPVTGMRKSHSTGSRSRVVINPKTMEKVLLPQSLCVSMTQSSERSTKHFSNRDNVSTCSTSTLCTASIRSNSLTCSYSCSSSYSSAPKQQIIPFLDLLRKLHVLCAERERNGRLSQHLTILRQAHIECELGQAPEARSSRTEKLHRLGPMGVALFSPLDGAFEYDKCHDEQLPTKDEDSAASSEQQDLQEELVEEAPQVSIHPEDESTLESSPHILTPCLMTEIEDRGLPCIIKGMTWKRLYCLSRDGDAFSTFLRMVQGHKFTLVVVKTTDGDVVGGFVDNVWEERKGTNQRSFYGSGQSFLFSVKSNEETLYGNPQDGKNQVELHKWSGENHYNQFCDINQGRIAMGGGGGFNSQFGLCVEDYFARGSTGPCQTFRNKALVEEGYFDVLDFEVYGFIHSWC